MVEGGGLENRCAERYRGFESYSLRQKMYQYGEVTERLKVLAC